LKHLKKLMANIRSDHQFASVDANTLVSTHPSTVYLGVNKELRGQKQRVSTAPVEWESSPNPPGKKYLIIGPAWIGDMVMAQVLFKRLKQREPTSIIHVAAPAWTQALLARMPEVQKIIPLPFKHGELGLRKRYQMGRALRGEQYDHAIILQISYKSALIPFFANILQRTGARTEFRYGVLNDIRVLNKQDYPLMIQQYAAFAEPQQPALSAQELPWPKLIVSAKNRALCQQKYHIPLDDRPILALCPGAEYGPAKRWPSQHFAAVANAKLNEDWQVWILGSPNDQTVAEEIQHLTHQRCLNLTGETTLLDAIDLLSLANIVLSNDSGLMHIASALDLPVVVIYGSSSPRYTPPLTQKVNIQSLNLTCSPCFKRHCPLSHTNCLKQLLPEQILAALNTLSVISKPLLSTEGAS